MSRFEAFNQLRASFYEHWKPVGAAVTRLVEQLAACRRRINRASSAEVGILDAEMFIQHKSFGQAYSNPSAEMRLGDAMTCLEVGERLQMHFISVWESRIVRTFERNVKLLTYYRRLRGVSPVPIAPQEEINAIESGSNDPKITY